MKSSQPMHRVMSPPLHVERSLWPAVALLGVSFGFFELTNADVAVQDRLYDFTAHRWMIDAHAQLSRAVFYTGPKAALIALGSTLLMLALTPERWRWRGRFAEPAPRHLWVALLTLGGVPAAIGQVKAVTNVFSPSEIRRYGGDVRYVRVLESFPVADRPARAGRSFPAGHASGGFALVALSGLARSRRWQIAGIALGAVAGGAMGFYQMAKGAHYLSHTVVTALLVWIAFLCWRRLLRATLPTLPIRAMNSKFENVSRKSAPALGLAFAIFVISVQVLRSEERSPDPRMPGVFDTELPQTQPARRLRILLRPHFGDFARHDYLRVPLGFRYGLSESIETSAEIESFMAHGLGSAAFGSRFGVSGLRLAAKERLPRWPAMGETDTVIGFAFSTPFGTPPPELTDGRRHYAPYVTFARAIPGLRRLSGFTSFGADLTAASGFAGVRRKNALLENSLTFTTGAVWHGEDFVGTLELGYTTSAFGSREDRQVFSVRPGVAWRIPNSRWLHPDGKWIVGVGTRVGVGPDGSDVGLSVKFRGEFDFRRWVRSLRGETR